MVHHGGLVKVRGDGYACKSGRHASNVRHHTESLCAVLVMNLLFLAFVVFAVEL